jgi:ubiquinone/menaquinone biosynthesis C-methylase UbiE
MTTDYNAIAAEYKRCKQQPWRLHVEYFTLLELTGALAGKSVLDFACGEGFYSRALRRRGAARVVGVDLSDGMIGLAREEEKREPLGVEYVAGDAKDFKAREPFDLVVAGYLLNYASTRDELLAMARAIARNLKPGGRFITVNNNPAHTPEFFPTTEKYGFVKLSPEGALREGGPVIYRIFLDGSSFDITNYHLSVATHEVAFQAAGLRDVRWHPPRLSPQGEAESGRPYWAAFLDHPPVIFIECRT